MSIEEYFGDWLKVIDKNDLEGALPYLQYMYNTKEVFPSFNNIFKAFHLCPFNDLKLIIIGQDPYHDLYLGKPRATGLAFANSNDIPYEDLSPSLQIIKESIINFEKPHNNIIFASQLEEWAQQGVLLLNSALTVERGKPCSHLEFWRPFIGKFLVNLSAYHTGMTYALFGKEAQSFSPYINEKTSTYLPFNHPAYYARNHTKMDYMIFPSIAQRVKNLTGYNIKWYEEN